MNENFKQKTTTNYLLKLSADEKRKLQQISVRNNTTILSVIRYLMQSDKSINEL